MMKQTFIKVENDTLEVMFLAQNNSSLICAYIWKGRKVIYPNMFVWYR